MFRNIRKSIAILLAMSGLQSVVYAKEQNTDYLLIYENTFDNGKADVVVCENEYLNLSVNTTPAINDAELNSDKGIAMSNSQGVANQTFLFDFTKGGSVSGLTEGTYKISYNFSINPESSQQAFTGINMKNHWDGGRAVYFSKNGYCVMPSIGAWSGTYVLPQDEVATLEMIIDLDNNIISYLVDGESVGNQVNLDNYKPITNYSIALGGAIDYIDNIRIEKKNNTTPEIPPEIPPEIEPDPIPIPDTDEDELSQKIKGSEGYKLLYNNAFENGANDFIPISNDSFKMLSPGTPAVITTEFNGNKGIGLNPNDKRNSRTFLFDFTNDGNKEAINSGIYKISFKYAVNSEGNADEAIIGTNMTSSWEGGRMVYLTKTNFGPVRSIGGWQNEVITEKVEAGALYDVELIFNFDERYVNYYLNGKNIHNQTISSMNNFSMALSGVVKYLDDFKIESFETLGMYGAVSKVSEQQVIVKFTDAVKKGGGGNCIIRDVYSGELIEASFEKDLSKTIKVLPEKNFEAGREYEIILPDNIEGNEGGLLKENTIRFSYSDDTLLKEVLLEDIWGKTQRINEINPAEIKKVILNFGESIDAGQLKDDISIADKDGNTVEFNFRADGNTVELKLDRCFFGNNEYILTIESNDEMVKDYQIKIPTKEGGISFKTATWKVNGQTVEDISQIQTGACVDVELVYVYTDLASKSFLASAALYNGYSMTDFAYEKFFVDNTLDEYTVRLKLNVTSEDKLKLKGFLWKAESGTHPLCKEMILE